MKAGFISGELRIDMTYSLLKIRLYFSEGSRLAADPAKREWLLEDGKAIFTSDLWH